MVSLHGKQLVLVAHLVLERYDLFLQLADFDGEQVALHSVRQCKAE